jgi:ketosteroid isomerase-like protein
LYSEDITFQLPEIEKVPFAGSHKGRAALAAFVQSVRESQEALAFNPVEFIAQGDKVVVLGNYSWRVKANGREYSSDWAHIVTFSDGKITAFKEYMDTGTAAAAYQ